MSDLRSILLHLDASPRSVTRLLLAHDLATLHDARVTALYASRLAVPGAPFATGTHLVEILPDLQRLDQDCRDNARKRFQQFESTATRPFDWCEVDDVDIVAGVARQALFADLLVLGQHDASDTMTAGVPADFVPGVLMSSGRPALVLPHGDCVATFGRRALIAWQPTREAARAVTAALPFLRRSTRIDLTIGNDRHRQSLRPQVAALEAFLRLHGVEAPVRWQGPVPDEAPGEGLLSLAADLESDLLVMGCYGHSRVRELVLGGASRTVLASMTLPVLMAH